MPIHSFEKSAMYPSDETGAPSFPESTFNYLPDNVFLARLELFYQALIFTIIAIYGSQDT